MAIIGSFSYGSASAVEYSTVEELLSQLIDNTDNIIVAQDIRDAVYTLWERTDVTPTTYFQNSNLTPFTIGGIPAGSSFSTPTDMQTMWNSLLYPYVAPTSNLEPNYIREFGDPDGLALNSLTLNWSVVKNTYDVTSITVNDQIIIPTGSSQTGNILVNGTHSWNSSNISEVNTFTMSVTDGQDTDIDISTLTWKNRIYWGNVNLGTINLTTDSNQVPFVASICDDDLILNLDGAGVGYGSELTTTISKSYNGINGDGQHLIFAWPTSFSNSQNPNFTVNGLTSTAFTRVRTSSPFVNQYGYTINYEVWVSNTLQNSTISLFNIS